jgi:hypothetical protein
VFWTYLGIISLVTVIDPQCQALIDANSQTVDLIRSIQVNYTVGKLDNPKHPIDQVSWSREARRERIKIFTDAAGFEPTSDGRPQGISDLLIDGDAYKLLRNWDPKNPQKITPVKQGTVRATMGPQTNVNATTHAPSYDLYFEVDCMPRRTLRELAKVSPKVTCKGQVQMDGRELWLLSLESPEETTATTMKKYYDIYLDPNAGHMIRKLVVNSNVMMPDGKIVKDAHAHEVLDYKDFGDGIFVPTRIRHGTPEKWLSELVVTSIKVNEPIPPETFEMVWPKYAQIVHFPPVDGKLKVEVWGDDKPIQEIKGIGDLRTVEAELRNDPRTAADIGPDPGVRPPPPMATLTKLFIGFVALLALMIGLVIWRRIREQAAA